MSALVQGCNTTCVNGYYGSVCYTTGYYYDSRVSGIDYETRLGDEVVATGVTGDNGDPGRFLFVEGATVSFSLGGTDLGEAAANERVTLFDVVGITEQAIGGCDVSASLPDDGSAFRIVHNVAALLQTLDTDGDPTGTIDISPEVAALLENVSIDFDQPWEAFRADTDLQGLLAAANDGELFQAVRELREREDALRALYQGIGLCP
ncbi:MAG: hypothetical protein HKN93_10495 [Acidimicrobiia bacterium]|nr:hypothetical protein [Acidimicrobiia bacterium]